MLSMDFRPCRELGLVFRLKSLLAIPPGTAAVKIISNVRGADYRHVFSPLRQGKKGKYSTNFLIRIVLTQSDIADLVGASRKRVNQTMVMFKEQG